MYAYAAIAGGFLGSFITRISHNPKTEEAPEEKKTKKPSRHDSLRELFVEGQYFLRHEIFSYFNQKATSFQKLLKTGKATLNKSQKILNADEEVINDIYALIAYLETK